MDRVGAQCPQSFSNWRINSNEAQSVSSRAPPRTEYCANCSMELATAQDMRLHLEQHEQCPSEDCSFAAMTSILEQHIEANHITGLYKTVKKVWTPEDVAAWRAERCKRFPTAANVEIAKQAKEQRLKRGERLEASKTRFGKPEDRRRTRPQTNNRDHPKKTNKPRNKSNTQVARIEPQKPQTSPVTTEKHIAVGTIGLRSICSSTFRGTSKMTDYKHVKTKEKDKVNALSSMLGMYGTDSENEDETSDADNSDEIDFSPVSRVEPKTGVDTIVELGKDVQSIDMPALKCPAMPLVDIETKPPSENGSGSCDEAPEELPIERKTETDSAPSTTKEQINPKATEKCKSNTVSNVKRPAPKKVHSGLNYKRARRVSHQNTMLSKLLAPDIRHERNVLLQCVRYVCEQNFFGIGKSGLVPDLR
ncbi:nuclear fragile X mental retardation-interacting protein 1 isoform X2 [Drosophila novamexicana]|uniref:nuclear fragile X mental retardation-interacting protein 1 isoform X2 n=1 Tax=Drosophila novamexicana TaxID=47314 RepID=UPI0011E5BB9F|nr:nuclear fragile X mental retardation-interacting protein 1 isoform X2 [Drosophila novamexicana]